MKNNKIGLEDYLNIAPAASNKINESYIPFENKGIVKSLENIVSNSAPENNPKDSPLENMISDKAKTLKASVLAVLEEINLRENLNSYQFQIIDKEISKQNMALINLENLKDSYPFDLTKDLDEAKTKIKSNVLELEKEKRAERLECWRDLMDLKKDLMGSLKDYWELSRRRGVLENSI